MSTMTIHTAVKGIAEGEGDGVIALGNGLSLVRPNDQWLSRRWDWVQSGEEMAEEANASRYLVYEYDPELPNESRELLAQQSTNYFYTGLIAFQIIKPIRTLGFIYRSQQVERRPPMQPGQWAMKNVFSSSMLQKVPSLIERVKPVMEGSDVKKKNALILLQLGLEHFHPYIAGLLWATGIEAVFDSGGRELFKKKICDCLGPRTMAFPNWHSYTDAPTYTVEQLALDLYTLRNKLAHGADLRSAATDTKFPVDLLARTSISQYEEETNYAFVLCEAACYLLCQVLQVVL